jgi:hypothetical protein
MQLSKGKSFGQLSDCEKIKVGNHKVAPFLNSPQEFCKIQGNPLLSPDVEQLSSDNRWNQHEVLSPC